MKSSPICDARLPDGSRVNVIAPPLAIDGPALTIRKFKKDKLKLEQLMKFGSISPEGKTLLEIIGRVRCNVHRVGRYGLGQDDAAQLPVGGDRQRRAHHHVRGLRRASAAAAARGAPGDPPAEPRGRGPDQDERSRQELPAYAAGADHRRRGARPGGVRSPAGHEHGPRRLDGHAAREQSRAKPSAVWNR